MAYKGADTDAILRPRDGEKRSRLNHYTLLSPGYPVILAVHVLTWIASIVFSAVSHLGAPFSDNLLNHHNTLAWVNVIWQGVVVVGVLLHSGFNRNQSMLDVVGNVLVLGLLLTQMAIGTYLFGVTYVSNNDTGDCLLALLTLFFNMFAAGMVIAFYVAFAIDSPGKGSPYNYNSASSA